MDTARPEPGLRVLCWQAGRLLLLVPAAAVLEVVRLPAGSPAQRQPPTQIRWRGHDVPVFTPDAGEPPAGARLLICAGPLPGAGTALVAILARTQPRLTTITAAGLLMEPAADGSPSDLPPPDRGPVPAAGCRPLRWQGAAAAALDLAAIQRLVAGPGPGQSSASPTQPPQVP